jgi:isoaspartyl peptidase/L-asparaginase-like protein (Ntn-hydrolase superfamily)
VAIEAASKMSKGGGSLLDILEAGLAASEDYPELVAIGRGSIPNSEGRIQLDASIMTGDTLECGAVCGMEDVLPAISVARKVMTETDHVMLCGEGARNFAISQGYAPQNLHTADSCRRYSEFAAQDEKRKDYVHTVDDGVPTHDTVTVLGVENGKCAAASSTSGLAFKLPGRVGDSPIVGAGIYADDLAGAAGATGWGEELWKTAASFRVVEGLRRGLTPQESCEEVITSMVRRRPEATKYPSVVLAVGLDGSWGAACCFRAFDMWVLQDGLPVKHHFEPVI